MFDIVEVPPVFPGGEKAMFEYLSRNIKYPVEAQKQKIEGRVTMQSVVDDEGKITSTRIIRSVDPLLDAEAIRIITSMPNWTPGKQGGKNVSVRYVLPIQFRLQGNGKSEKTSEPLSGSVSGISISKDGDSPVITKTTITKTSTAEKFEKDVLVILDGKEIPKEKMNEIDPKTIDNISVLKDKSATDLYGEKGKNGVIEITSKK